MNFDPSLQQSYIHTHKHTHTHTYIYIYIYTICTHIRDTNRIATQKSCFMRLGNTNTHTHTHTLNAAQYLFYFIILSFFCSNKLMCHMKGTLKYTHPAPARNSWMNGQNASTLYSKTLSQQTLLRKFSIWVEVQTKHLLTEVRTYHFRQPT